MLKLGAGVDQSSDGDAALLAVGLRKSHNNEPTAIGTTAQVGDRGRALSAAVYQHAPLERGIIHNVREHITRGEQPAERNQRGNRHDAAPDPDIRHNIKA